MDETKENYISKGYPTEDFTVKASELEEEFIAVLRSKGFKIAYAVGEFHLLSYSKLSDLSVGVPWESRDKEPSALRIGL